MGTSGRRAAVGTLAVIAFLVIVLGFYPGMLSADSLTQFDEAVTGWFRDNQPPAMAWFWSVLCRGWQGPQPMLVMQAAFLSASLGLMGWVFARRWKNPLALAFPLIALLPFVLNFSGVIWKDVQLADSLLLGSCLLIALAASERVRPLARWTVWMAALLLFLYGSRVRVNGPAALAPLAVLAAAAMFPRLRPGRWRPAWTWVAGALLFAGLLADGRALESRIPAVRPQRADQLLYFYDLSGISVRIGRPVFPDFVLSRPGFSLDRVRRQYSAVNLNTLIFNTDEPRLFKGVRNDAQADELRSCWFRAVREHPSAWLAHRSAVFAGFLGATGPTCYPVHWGMQPNDLGIEYRENGARLFLKDYLLALSDTFLFKVWFWMLLSLAGLILAWRLHRRTRSPVVAGAAAMFASGLLLALTFFFGVATDFRYAYWTILSACVAWLLLAGEWWNSRASASEAQRA